jgi:hypothetical protein
MSISTIDLAAAPVRVRPQASLLRRLMAALDRAFSSSAEGVRGF